MNNKIIKIGIGFFLSFLCCANHINAQTINMGTYNIRNDNPGDIKNGNGWQQRLPYVCKLIQYHGFDIFGTQEGLHHQLEDMKSRLPRFDYIGAGRDDGRQAGEYAAVFYNKDRFELIRSGDFWLAEDSGRPALGWDAACIRICTWGEFRDKMTGKTFCFFNLHTDHIGIKARLESAKLVISKIKDIADNSTVVLTGDFNAGQNDESYRVYTSSDLLVDAYDRAAFTYTNNGTFNNFDLERKTDDRIDHIFFCGNIRIHHYAVLTDIYWDDMGKARIPSDHYPVVIKAELY